MTTYSFDPSVHTQTTFLGSGTGKLTLSPKTAFLLEDYSYVTPRFQLNLTLSPLGILLLTSLYCLNKEFLYPQTTPATLVHSAIYTVLRIGETI